ncbi:hypothetical protein [Candidatus Poriferisocius sp.]|uniref:hypothetical protein n=1 Tax=Candidatus Poriferisocius sp. TaxID=3101276 RepID=UPI003B026EE0
MFFWFLALSFVLVALVFDSPALDYRMVMLGSLLPMVELLAGGPWALHTLLAPLVVLLAVMLATRGRRLARRRWLGLPIGLFLYLVLDGAWLRTDLFWWPVFGVDVANGGLPEFKPAGALIALELIGLAVGAWAVRRYGLTDRQRLRLFCTQGRLDRSQMGADRRQPRQR